MDYSREFGSQFPDEIITVGTRKDVDDSIIDLITQYYAYIAVKDLDSATNLYNANKDVLEPYSATMEYFNRLEEHVYNTGLLALKKTTMYFGSVEPLDQPVDGFWYQDY